MVDTGRADRANTWAEVVSLVGPEAKLTQLACIEKERDGKIKTRLIVDVRRSGVNGCMSLFERICLPRVSDVAAATRELLNEMHPEESLEFMVVDFTNAFYTLRVDPRERKWLCIKSLDGTYILPKCICFGLACGPVLGLFSLANRETSVYVDDPIIVAKGRIARDRAYGILVLANHIVWEALGFKLAWHKAKRAPHSIGSEFG